MEPLKISMESLPVEITHIRFLAFIGVYLFTVIFYIECFKIIDLGICVMYQSTPSVAFPLGLVPEDLPSIAADLNQNFSMQKAKQQPLFLLKKPTATSKTIMTILFHIIFGKHFYTPLAKLLARFVISHIYNIIK